MINYVACINVVHPHSNNSQITFIETIVMFGIKSNLLIGGILFSVFISSCVSNKGLLIIKEQGSFAVGGSVIKNEGTFDPIKRTPEGQTFHGDHAYINYQIPAKTRKYPLVF